MKLLTWLLFRYAGDPRLEYLELAITDELNLRASFTAHGQKSPNQQDPWSDLLWLLAAVTVIWLIARLPLH